MYSIDFRKACIRVYEKLRSYRKVADFQTPLHWNNYFKSTLRALNKIIAISGKTLERLINATRRHTLGKIANAKLLSKTVWAFLNRSLKIQTAHHEL